MTVENINVAATLEKARALLKSEKNLSPAVVAILEVLILVVTLRANRLGRNSHNSSRPPSQDPHRKRQSKSQGKAGGQIGHKGRTLQKTDHPHRIEEIAVDRRTIPQGTYTKRGYESRQVFDVTIELCVTEYRAEILEDASGRRYVAPFPDGVTNAAPYGNEGKAQSVYLSQFQRIPLARVEE
jgi:transposase